MTKTLGLPLGQILCDPPMGIHKVGFWHPLVMHGIIAVPPDKAVFHSSPAFGDGAVLKILLNLRTLKHRS